MIPRISPRALVSVVTLITTSAVASSVSARDFFAPEERTRVDTAYTLAPGQFALEVGVLGLGDDEVFSQIGLSYALPFNIEISANLAHAGVGIVNLQTKWNFIDTKHFALAARMGVVWVNGEWVWILPPVNRAAINEIDAVMLPVGVVASAPVTDWFQADLDVGYTHAEVFGEVDGNRIYADLKLGARQFSLQPSIRFFFLEAAEFYMTAFIAPYTGVPGNAETQVTLMPGVYAGAQSGGFVTRPIEDTFRLKWGVRSAISKTFFVNFALQWAEAAQTLYGTRLSPAFDIEFRF